jgi:hypothetical protein
MGSIARLAKALRREVQLNNNTKVVESDEDKEYQKYLDSLTNEDLEELIKTKLTEYRNSKEGQAYHLRISEMTEIELAVEIKEKLKVY